jgi:Leu/Phe-tRNA-protein transferase
MSKFKSISDIEVEVRKIAEKVGANCFSVQTENTWIDNQLTQKYSVYVSGHCHYSDTTPEGAIRKLKVATGLIKEKKQIDLIL